MFGSTEERGHFLFQELLQLSLHPSARPLLQRGVLHCPGLDDRIAGSLAYGGVSFPLGGNRGVG